MDISEALSSRRSVRAFLPERVDRATIEKIFAEANNAPSWANTQPWILHVAGGEVLERIRAAYLENARNNVPRAPDIAPPASWPPQMQKRMEELRAVRAKLGPQPKDENAARMAMVQSNFAFFGAPVVVWMCMDRALSQWSLFDLGSMAQSIMLSARGHGLDSIPAFMFGAYPAILRKELQIPDELSIAIGIAIGHADRQSPQDSFRASRRELKEFCNLSGF